MKDVKMDDVRFVLERFFYGWKMNAIVFDADGKLVDFVMGTREKVDFSKKEELEGSIDVEDNDLYDTIHSKAEKANAPIIYVGQDGIYYLAFWMMRNDSFFLARRQLRNYLLPNKSPIEEDIR